MAVNNTFEPNGPKHPEPKQKPPEPPKADDNRQAQTTSTHVVPSSPDRSLSPGQGRKVDAPPVDHLAEIEQLAHRFSTTSPSGCETLCQQILVHVGALRNPAAYDKSEAEKREAQIKVDAKQAKEIAERRGKQPAQ